MAPLQVSSVRGEAAASAGSDLLLTQARAGAQSSEQRKIEKAGKDFESVLLGSWLQGAERSFAAAPGGETEDEDGGQDQYMSMAMQQLAGSIVGAGGIGIAKMITEHLSRAASSAAEKVPAMHR